MLFFALLRAARRRGVFIVDAHTGTHRDLTEWTIFLDFLLNDPEFHSRCRQLSSDFIAATFVLCSLARRLGFTLDFAPQHELDKVRFLLLQALVLGVKQLQLRYLDLLRDALFELANKSLRLQARLLYLLFQAFHFLPFVLLSLDVQSFLGFKGFLKLI